jgi:hypothetical protein
MTVLRLFGLILIDGAAFGSKTTSEMRFDNAILASVQTEGIRGLSALKQSAT